MMKKSRAHTHNGTHKHVLHINFCLKL